MDGDTPATLDDVAFVACGGGARALINDAEDRLYAVPAIIDSVDSDVPLEGGPDGPHWDENIAYGVVSANANSVSKLFEGRRIALVYSEIGGGTASGMMPAIIECARSSGCKVVSVVSLPMEFEEARRERALRVLPEIVGKSDRTFIMDRESLNRRPHLKAVNLMQMTMRTMVFVINSLREQLEGPFFSTFSQSAYTFSYLSSDDPAEIVEAAESTVFATDPNEGKLIILTGSGYELAKREQVRDAVVAQSGILPEIITRGDPDDTKFLVYASVKLRGRFFSQVFPYLMIFDASPKTPMMVLYSYLVGIARPIMRLNMTVVISRLLFGYSIASSRSPKKSKSSAFSCVSAGSGLRGVSSAMKNSYITVWAAWDRFMTGYSAQVGMWISTSHMLISFW